MPKQRIQKILAAAGFGSRRACEELVADGRVTIDGEIADELPIVVDPAVNKIKVDDKPVRIEKFVYYLLNKPKGYFCTNSDPEGRRRAVDLMVGVRQRVYPVGRLDAESMGLLIMTNDGDLALKLTHPRFQAPKTYRAEVRGQPENESLEKLRKGVWLAEGRTGPADITVIHSSRKKTVLEITLREGRNREIRRMLARFGHPVLRLTRIKMGRINIKRLPMGSFRPLTDDEVKYLYRLADGLEKGDDEMPVKGSGGRPRKKAGATRRGGTSRHGGRSSAIRGRRNAGKKKTTRRAATEPAGTAGSKKKSAKKVAKKTGPSKKSGTLKKTGTSKKAPKRQPQERETPITPNRGKKKRRIIYTD